jgi:peptide deformylase
MILVEGDPRLRQPAARVDHVDPADLAEMAEALAAFRREHGFGRGLAAPQLGIGRRLIVLDLGNGPFFLVNPEIIWRSPELFELWDDCFSVPDKLARVRRHRSITVSHGGQLWERLPEAHAELVQHEIDHLDGILMTDRALDVRPSTERAALIDSQRA